MIKYISFACILSILVSCVSQDKYYTVNSEKNALQKEKDSLQKELDEIKFGAPNLLADGKKFFGAKDYLNAKEKLSLLVQKHSDRPESAEARQIIIVIDEEHLWNTALNSSNIHDTENYITNYRNGKYILTAKRRMRELKIANERAAYENALSQNSSSVWKSFVSQYPHRSDIAEIQRRIIKCEVDEIMGDRETGQLPTSNLVSNGDYSPSSSISITNDTGCELTVRYSGTDVIMIEIPVGRKRSVNLTSGSYRIAASACGANYAGTEELQGSYSSRYYISRALY